MELDLAEKKVGWLCRVDSSGSRVRTPYPGWQCRPAGVSRATYYAHQRAKPIDDEDLLMLSAD